MIGREHYFLENLEDEEDAEILSNFIKQYYMGRAILPNKIMIKENIEDKELLEELLTNMAERKVEIKVPQKGEKLRLVEMAEKNNIPIITGSTFNNNPGTIISHKMEASGVKSIVKKDVSRISVVGFGISSRDEILNKILEIANKKSLELDNNSNEVKDIVNNLNTTLTKKDKYILNQSDKDKIDSLSIRIRFKILCFSLKL